MKKQIVKLLRMAKVLRQSYARPGRQYESGTWWDENFYEDSISDSDTIGPGRNRYSTAYHYASVEALICKALFERLENGPVGDVIDIGSGAGHWLDFYTQLGASSLHGVEVSQRAYKALNERYANTPNMTLAHGTASDALAEVSGKVDLVNAIGVMFHIVSDDEWRETIQRMAGVLKPGGLLVVGGWFGSLDGLNAQVDKQGRINKRLRSASNWKRTLASSGFDEIEILRNRMRDGIADAQPENHLLVARRAR
ncbi:class I SAM-dependent methyltransferase [Hwanghaeella grinnelliae]|uniref:Class I SAM-dependent methyltransferase n=1 Tax=Hwanghaeella grinnelliae TaxID=2500179 RepID=A0A3S2VQ15_9PROT|nr:class I SAM-dependent methyltransferase [Hwanghaeella grinnelliae]RVU36774.1 class I SAM-dependent methyltransferase [Hwanghaeella grinnelliae]